MKMGWLWRVIVVTTLAGTLSIACRKATVSDESSAAVTQADAPSECQVNIASSALEGCQTPNEPGCEVCWNFQSNGMCRILSGHAHVDELWRYTSASAETDCPATGPRCARCMRASEYVLRVAPQCRDCDCRIDPGVDPCFERDGCGCYCSAYIDARAACPPG